MTQWVLCCSAVLRRGGRRAAPHQALRGAVHGALLWPFGAQQHHHTARHARLPALQGNPLTVCTQQINTLCWDLKLRKESLYPYQWNSFENFIINNFLNELLSCMSASWRGYLSEWSDSCCRSDSWATSRCRGSDAATRTSSPWTASPSSPTSASRPSLSRLPTLGRCRSHHLNYLIVSVHCTLLISVTSQLCGYFEQQVSDNHLQFKSKFKLLLANYHKL